MSLASPAKKTNTYKSCCSLELHRNSQKNIHSKVQFVKKLHALSRKFRKKKNLFPNVYELTFYTRFIKGKQAVKTCRQYFQM